METDPRRLILEWHARLASALSAIAHANEAVLITYNVKDFAGLENLIRVIDAA